MVRQSFWQDKRVFLTGHTGFKGSWLSLWLTKMGARVIGYALEPPTNPSLFQLGHIAQLLDSQIGDIRDLNKLKKALMAAEPDIVIHMAAQPLVRESYHFPVETYQTNVLGTVNLLEAVRNCSSVQAVVNVTTDKCYENKEWCWGYREDEPLGGYDPYSSSKACSELVTAAYRNSFLREAGVRIATARAGNVIGGGDWAKDRLIPDCLKSLVRGEKIVIRSPQAIRPWQHVLEPLSGYLLLAERLYEKGQEYAESWNFGPLESEAKSVEWIVGKLCDLWGGEYIVQGDNQYHEANYLKLDCSKAKSKLNWSGRWNLPTALEKIVEWQQNYLAGMNMQDFSLKQIEDYQISK